jgi:hypothetical protein
LIEVQRGFALQITRAYRTISTNVALVIAGITPVYITAIAQSELTYRKKGAEGTPRIFQQEVEKKTHFLSMGHPRDYPYFVSETICNRRHDYQIYTNGSRTQRNNGEEIVGCATCRLF